jgi:carboxyl-terminal processing protease
LLHGLGDYADALPAPDRLTAVEALDATLRASFAGAHQRPVDWDGLRRRHEPAISAAVDPLPGFQRWLGELGDLHTTALPGIAVINSPYVISADSGAVRLMRVPRNTAAFRAGARPGWTLCGIDGEDWRGRCGAPAHVRGLLAGRRLTGRPTGSEREFAALAPDGQRVTWIESGAVAAPAARWRRLSPTVGLIAVDGWTAEVVGQLDAALAQLRGCDGLIMDLRGNTGGSLVAAVNARRRFLRERTHCGTIRYTDGRGGLGDPYGLTAEPADESRWRGRLVVLTDPLTASASEDFLLGLHGLPHVRVIGTATAGGSGRPVTRHLLPGIDATISTALTYDRDGHCIEGRGIRADTPIDPFDDDAVIDTATSELG